MQIPVAGRVILCLCLMLGLNFCHSSFVHERINPRDGLKIVWIAPGSYTTGCTELDHECMGGGRERQSKRS